MEHTQLESSRNDLYVINFPSDFLFLQGNGTEFMKHRNEWNKFMTRMENAKMNEAEGERIAHS